MQTVSDGTIEDQRAMPRVLNNIYVGNDKSSLYTNIFIRYHRCGDMFNRHGVAGAVLQTPLSFRN